MKTKDEIIQLATKFAKKCDPLNLTIEIQHHIITGYSQGYQDAQEQDNWISVKDKLPTPNEVVLIFWDNKITSGSYKDFHNGYFQHGAATQLKVTHWQPLPNPPKSK